MIDEIKERVAALEASLAETLTEVKLLRQEVETLKTTTTALAKRVGALNARTIGMVKIGKR